MLCLEALLDACQSGVVDDMRHVIEQVSLARKILIGDEDGVGLSTKTGGEGTASANVNSVAAAGGADKKAASGLSSTWIGKLGASSSVTSLATLSNLVG